MACLQVASYDDEPTEIEQSADCQQDRAKELKLKAIS